ncbi:hypothetical protein H8356DRAFT_937259, partial [Neocallimastix lanati (nom. inval.)]
IHRNVKLLIVNYFVKLRTNINKENICSEISLIYECNSRNGTVVKYHLFMNVTVGMGDGTSLFVACDKVNESIIKSLIEHGSNVNK